MQTFYVIFDIHRMLPETKISWCVDERFEEIAKLHPNISNVIVFPSRRWRKNFFYFRTWLDIFCWLKGLRSLGVDISIDLQGLYKSAFIGVLSGARTRAGKDRHSVSERWVHFFYNFRIKGITDEGLATGARYLACKAVGTDVKGYPLNSGIRQWKRSMDSHLLSTVYVVIGASKTEKTWPASSWIQLCRSLLNFEKVQIVILWGSEAERQSAESIAGIVSSDLVRAAPRVFSITKLYGLFREATLVVGGDTGLVHLSAALGIPTVIIFLATVAARYTHPELENQFFADSKGGIVSPEQVFKEACLALNWTKQKDKS